MIQSLDVLVVTDTQSEPCWEDKLDAWAHHMFGGVGFGDVLDSEEEEDSDELDEENSFWEDFVDSGFDLLSLREAMHKWSTCDACPSRNYTAYSDLLLKCVLHRWKGSCRPFANY